MPCRGLALVLYVLAVELPAGVANSVVTVSWGWPPAFALPEIYYNGCNSYAGEDIQWGMISLRAANNRTGLIYFFGALGEASAPSLCESLQKAYIDLWNVTNSTPSTAMTLNFATSLG